MFKCLWHHANESWLCTKTEKLTHSITRTEKKDRNKVIVDNIVIVIIQLFLIGKTDNISCINQSLKRQLRMWRRLFALWFRCRRVCCLTSANTITIFSIKKRWEITASHQLQPLFGAIHQKPVTVRVKSKQKRHHYKNRQIPIQNCANFNDFRTEKKKTWISPRQQFNRLIDDHHFVEN